MIVSGTTRITAIIGTPIAQVKSPINFNEHHSAQGDDAVMIPLDIKSEGVKSFVDFVRNAPNFDGFVVTIPHKQVIATLVDIISPRAKLLGAVNVVRRMPDGTLHGDMLDGIGFYQAAQAHGFDANGKTAQVIGSGGAGSAIANALCEAGLKHLYISDFNAERLEHFAQALREHYPNLTVTTGFGDASSVDILVNATPCGMKETDPLPLDAAFVSDLPKSAHVADVITSPVITPLLALAQSLGLSTQTGPEMAKSQTGQLGQFMGVISVQSL